MANLRQFASRYATPIFVGAHILIALPLAVILNVWIDEGYSIHTTGQGLAYAFHQAVYLELQPPLYFIALTIWRMVSDSYIHLRLFSLLCTSCSVAVGARLSRRYIPGVSPAWITFALAINPFLIWAAVEIRVYALIVLLTALLLLFFYDGFLAPQRRVRFQWLYCATALAALYTQYYIGFLLVANACVLAAIREWRRLFRYIACMLAVGVLFSPMMLVISRQVDEHTATVHGATSVKDGVRLVYTRVQEYAAPIYESADLANLFSVHHELAVRLGERTTLVWLLVRYGFAAMLVTLVLACRRAIDIHTITLFIIMIVCGMFYVGVLRITGEDLLRPRHTASLFVPALFFVFGLLALTPERIRGRALTVYTVAYTVLTAAALWATYGHTAKLGDFKRVAAYVGSHESPGEPILVFHAEAEMPLRVHYNGQNVLTPLPRPLNFKDYDLEHIALRNSDELKSALASIQGHPQRMWLVTDKAASDCGYLNVEFGCDVLETYLREHFDVLDDQAFQDSRVRHLQYKPGASE